MTGTVLELLGASCSYTTGNFRVDALHPTSLRIAEGDFVAVQGPSGSGKSTLLSILGLLRRPSTGTLLFEGRDVVGFDDAQLSAIRGARIGFVFQASLLIPHKTVYENVELPLRYARVTPNRRRARVLEILAQMGISARAAAFPATLSGGEQQRAAIARALVRAPPILLCDEPTGNLDSASSVAVTGLLQAVNEAGCTIVVCTHDPRVASSCRRRMWIRDGTLSEED